MRADVCLYEVRTLTMEHTPVCKGEFINTQFIYIHWLVFVVASIFSVQLPPR